MKPSATVKRLLACAIPLLSASCGGEQATEAPVETLGVVQQAVCLQNPLTISGATALTVENAGLPASAAVDGNAATRWSSAFADPQWIQVDLGSSRFISRVVLTWEAAASADYDVQVATNAAGPWANVYTDAAGNGGVDNITGLAAQGRYVRVYSRSRVLPAYGNSLWEIQVYGDTDPNCTGGTAAICGNSLVESGEQCDDGNTTNGDGCSSTCQHQASNNCSEVRILQNRSNRYVRLQADTDLDYDGATTTAASAEVFVRNGGVGGFTLRAKSNNKYVVVGSDSLLEASHASAGAVFGEFLCGATPSTGRGALRVDFNKNGTLTDDGTNYWKSNGTLGMTGNCADTGTSWEKYQFEVVATGVACGAQACGNGTLEGTEQCDDGNTVDTDACRNTCVNATCGDGVVRAGVEACDDGNTSNTDACRNTCEVAVCGDTFIRAGVETCDDGNTATEACAYGQTSCTVCNATCASVPGATAYCGNGVVNSANGEACDDGNTATEACAYGQTSCTVCNATCASVPGATAYCGNGVVNSANGETCDDGNAVGGDGCSATCIIEVPPPVCGNGAVEAGEGCDDGNTVTEACAYGQTSCTVCNATCASVPGATAYCGNSVVNSANGETCDDGNAATEACAYGQTSCTVCNATCASVPGATAYCGNSVVNSANGETCDDGNVNNGDGCDSSCHTEVPEPVCGNGAVEAGEACDDGNNVTEACTYGQTNCTVCDGNCALIPGATAYCGNGVVNSANGEACDDGNTATEACAYGQTSCTVCNATCASVPGATAYCGNGVINGANGETCDDGNVVSGDGCSSACASEATEQLLTLTVVNSSGGWAPAPNAVIDGSTTTAANKTSTVVEWIEFSLPQSTVLTRARVFEDNAGAWNIETWNIQYWSGSAWVNAFALTNTPIAGWNEVNFPDVTTTALRVQVQDGSHPEFMEVQVYGLVGTGPTPVCGDGVVAATEECDDGNANNADACTNACLDATCGDGSVWAGVEECDDGNSTDTDACTDQCFDAACGDGAVWSGVEQCDDGNVANGDGCSASCATESSGGNCDEVVILQNRGSKYVTLTATDVLDWGTASTVQSQAEVFVRNGGPSAFTLLSESSGQYVRSVAGTLQATGTTGTVIAQEVCGVAPAGFGALRIDLNGDGNALNDATNYWKSNTTVGVTGACPAENLVSWEKFQVIVIDTGVSCQGPAPAVCGNGTVEPGEQCDDGNVVSGDGCSATCQITGTGPVCGNGVVEAGEQCDDGNVVNGDGCSATCQTTGTGAVCGNGVIEASEQCDDGNVANGDGCSSVCLTEGGGGECSYADLNVALATASSALGGSGAAQAVDGNSVTRWESVHQIDPQWFIVDLGGDRWVDDIDIEWESASSSDFDLEVSFYPDGPWAPVQTGLGAAVPDHTVVTYDMDVMARYVRLFSHERTTGYGVSFFEFTVFGDTDAFCGNPCGNSIINAGETCDDGNRITESCAYGQTSCTVCNSSCQTVAGTATRCGDGITDSLYEECDDSNTTNGDGCSSACILEASCLDMKQNQGETGIDCGGPCGACAGPGLDTRPSNPTSTGCVAPPAPQTTNFKLTRVFGGVQTSSPLTLKQEPGGSGRFYVVHKAGQVSVLPNNYGTTTKTTFIDINALEGVSNNNEDGMASMAFHPNYQQNGYVYLSYIMASPYQTRLARFTTLDGGATLAPSTKLVIRDEPITNNLHHSAQINFGPDGYLYMSVGDDGNSNPNPPADWPNRVKGSIIRIDVDHPSQGRNYGIPPNNPTWPNASNPAPEVFATGFRNAWRFNFDSLTGRMFAGDVGGGAREEVSIIVGGGNYGWPRIEGDPAALGLACPNCNTFPNILPIFNYSHGSPNQGAQGNAVIGGFVYRGLAMPGLNGDYVYADWTGNEVWALHENENGTWSNRELVTGFNNNISSLGEDRDGELYVMSLGNNSIWKLEAAGAQTGETFPAWLSDTNCVNPGPTLTPAAGVIPYTIGQAFWSDSAAKDRFIAIPNGTTISVDADGDWNLPEGGVLIKNFRANGKNFETRFVVRHFGGGWSAYTYAWLDDQSDAYLVGANPEPIDSEINPDIGIDWEYPGRSQCFGCHTSAANRALGIETRQMNVNNFYPVTGRTANQLVTFTALGMLTGNTASLAPFPALNNENTSLQRRAEAYLHTNCSNCHRPGGPGRGTFTALYDVPFAQKGMCDVDPSISSLGLPNARLIAPHDHSRSVIWERMSQRVEDFMPPLGSKIPDAAGAAMLQEWIDGMSGCPQP